MLSVDNPDPNSQIYVHSLELNPVSMKEIIKAEVEKARSSRANTDWFVNAKYGLMFHWTSQAMPRLGDPKPYAEAVRNFDVNSISTSQVVSPETMLNIRSPLFISSSLSLSIIHTTVILLL